MGENDDTSSPQELTNFRREGIGRCQISFHLKGSTPLVEAAVVASVEMN